MKSLEVQDMRIDGPARVESRAARDSWPVNPTRMLKIGALVAAAAFLGAACGDSETASSAPVIVVESSGAGNTDDSTASAADNDDASSIGTEEEQALEFAQCLRDEGIDFPDPVVNADGSIDFLGGVRGAEGEGPRDNPGFEDAINTCGDVLEGASFLPDQDDRTEMEDTFLEAAQCLRDNGLDVPDPDFSAGPGNGGGGPFGPDFDPDDPATIAAIDACEDVFTNLGAGRGGGG